MKLTDIIDDNYKNTDAKIVETIRVEKTALTEALLNIFSEYINYEKVRLGKNFDPNISYPFLQYLYSRTKPFVKEITPVEITKLSVCLGESKYAEHIQSCGTFLTVLINIHQDYTNQDIEYKLITNHLENKIKNIGIESKAKIQVYGDGGSCLGVRLNGGTITVNGNCQDEVGMNMNKGSIFISGNVHAGVGTGMSDGTITISGNIEKDIGEYMTGGTVIIKGNVKKKLAYKMNGGIIHAYGNAGESIGLEMTKGTVYLYGTYEHVSESFISGKIYHKGKLINSGFKQFVKNGELFVKSMFKKR